VEGTAVMATPCSVQDYGGDGVDYIEDYICFSGPLADHLLKSNIIKPGLLTMGNARRLLPIIEKALDPSDDAQIAANIALQQLLIDLFFENKADHADSRQSVIEQLVNDISKNVFRWWTVKEMATYCNLSENHFRSLFKKHIGMAPKNYLEHLKIRWAAEYLCTTHDPVYKVAEKLGYVDPYHFSKTFKRVTGLAPDHYRKQFHVF
jgi:transcriptional regulator GlxA family with amidase domain